MIVPLPADLERRFTPQEIRLQLALGMFIDQRVRLEVVLATRLKSCPNDELERPKQNAGGSDRYDGLFHLKRLLSDD